MLTGMMGGVRHHVADRKQVPPMGLTDFQTHNPVKSRLIVVVPLVGSLRPDSHLRSFRRRWSRLFQARWGGFRGDVGRLLGQSTGSLLRQIRILGQRGGKFLSSSQHDFVLKGIPIERTE